MLLIIHYELENIDTLPYVLRSTYRYLCKRKTSYKTETIFVQFIRNSFKINTSEQLLSLFKETKTKLEQINSDPFEKNFMDYFDLISWLESKIENRSFAEIVKEKAMHDMMENKKRTK